jgi:hypothetical protein
VIGSTSGLNSHIMMPLLGCRVYCLYQTSELKEISVEQVLKWDKSNDLWATILLEPVANGSSLDDKYIQQGIPAEIKDLIKKNDPIS